MKQVNFNVWNERKKSYRNQIWSSKKCCVFFASKSARFSENIITKIILKCLIIFEWKNMCISRCWNEWIIVNFFPLRIFWENFLLCWTRKVERKQLKLQKFEFSMALHEKFGFLTIFLFCKTFLTLPSSSRFYQSIKM